MSFTCTGDAQHGAPEPGAPPSAWTRFRLGGRHFFAGVGFLGALAYRGVTTPSGGTWATNVHGGLLLALHGGVLLDRHELRVELSPFSYFHDFTSPGPAFQAMASYGYLLPLGEIGSLRVYWPLRVGAGLLAGGSNTAGRAYFQALADVVGLAFGIGHVTIDVRAPSFRYAISGTSIAPPTGAPPEGAQLHLISFLLGANVSYVF